MPMSQQVDIARQLSKTNILFLARCHSLFNFPLFKMYIVLELAVVHIDETGIQRSSERSYKQQIAKVIGCSLRRIGTLSFDIGYPQTCTTARENIYVCFGSTGQNECYVSSEPLGQFIAIVDSTYGHHQTRLASSTKYAFAVGGWVPSHPHTELLDLHTKKWQRRASYPYADDIRDAPLLYYQSTFIIFGGYISRNPRATSVIARFSPATNQWTKLGDLLTYKSHHTAIQVPGSFLIVGGYFSGNFKMERCTVKNNAMKCKYEALDFGQYDSLHALPFNRADCDIGGY